TAYTPIEVLRTPSGEADLVVVRDGANKPFVVKHYRPGFRADQSIYDRVAQLKGHPAIVTIHRHGQDDGRAWEVLDYFPKGSLAERWDGTPMKAGEMTRFVRHLSRGIEALHRAKIRHGDLKPGNLLIRDSLAQPIITDFGISRRMDTTQYVTGKPNATYLY